MGIFMFLSVVIVEMAFTVFCTFSKSNKQKVRSIIRIVLFTAFVFLTTLTINKVCLSFFDCYLKREGKFTSGSTY